MKLYTLVLVLSSIASDANANNIRGTTNTNSSHATQEELDDVVSRCISHEHEDAEEEDDDITNMNIALCEDYFSLQCNTDFTNDCSTLLALYVSNDGREPSWPGKSSRKQLRDFKSQISQVAHECNIYTGKKRGHCIAFMAIQNGECCNNKYSKVCVLLISEWRFNTGDSNPYVPWSPM